MNLELLRGITHIHGHLGWIATAALIHPAVLLRPTNRGRRGALVVCIAATSLVTITGILGGVAYVEYSRLLRRSIYATRYSYGLLFERKEHLAFAVIALSWAGLFGHWSTQRGAPDESSRNRARFAHICYLSAATLALSVATMGTMIAAYQSF